MTKRIFSPYEQNQLRKWVSDINPQSIGETPIEYVTGHVEFLGQDYLVTKDTLIPRVESEQIVNTAFQFIDEHNIAHPTIADVGTGTGCLGISLAALLSKRQIPYTVFLSDISPNALKVADLNAQRILSSPENIFFQESNLFEDYPKIKFDLILANLPYIPTKNISTLDPSVKNFEPRIALDGGPKGNLFINALLDKLPDFLNQKGIAIFEIDDSHSIDSFTFPKGISGKIVEDCFEIPRFLVCSYL